MIPVLFIYSQLALAALRLGFGLIFLVHGWPKIKNLHFISFWGFIVAITEFLGGIFIIFGLFTQLAAFLLAIIMLVAMVWRIKNKQALSGGYEFDLILFLAAIILWTHGAGAYSLENYWQIWLL
ncbi:MAG: DoxX family protein [Candidatus Brennerbacteria bacterium]|nr:DoxX family protein [Candidatus Brennerbacteria bacterium]